MALDLSARPTPVVPRLPARSAVAGANVQRARHTLAELTESSALEVTGSRVIDTLRRFIVRDSESLHSRS